MKRRLMTKKIKRYEAGVYIQHKNGTLYGTGSWDTRYNADANGIVVISTAMFVIAKIASTWSYPWSSNTSTPVIDITTTTNAFDAIEDYSGLSNTNGIITQLSNCPAANYCNNYIFPNGQRGYLPSLGEVKLISTFYSRINGAMILIGGNILGATQGGGKYMDSSTQYNAEKRWMADFRGDWNSYNKTITGEVRPITTFD